ncbi:hypothetical protein GCM10027413_24610 [Conyzicola nivalis]|uniref:YCII-related domain-containing protein n=1 Tax=Conyzicola nivalis TaxID=1477021 RepID=A0A916WEP2_9MICO|nr:YciI family protein [Conyzicola nivalis]GGA90941.1 hypothetical protein GCM10010979_02010 [Conyzicola nivalis]
MLIYAEGQFTARPQDRPDGAEESQAAQALLADGSLVHAFIKTDLSGVFLVMEAESLAAADEIIAALPYAADGTLVFELSTVKDLFPKAA